MDNIGEILAKNQPERLPIWSEDKEKTCSCGKIFMDKVWHLKDGKTVESSVCKGCYDKLQREKDKKEAECKLVEVSESQKEYWKDNCGLPGYFLEKTFDNFDQQLQPKAYTATKNLQWAFKGDNPPMSLVLASPGAYGLGKTHLVCALVNKVINEEPAGLIDGMFNVRKLPMPFHFTTENNLIRRIRSTFNRGQETDTETESDIYKQLVNVKLLIIDDVGKVKPKDMSFTQGVYFDIIDGRYANHNSLIITTNLSYKEMENHIGGACADRLREMCGDNFVKMSGKSYRVTKK